MSQALPPVVFPSDPYDRGLPSEPKWNAEPPSGELKRETWVNWSGSQVATPELVIAPANEAEVVELVKRALADRTPLRPMGGGYSFSPLIPTSGIIVDTRRLSGIISIDHETSRVTVRPGTQILSLGDQLWEEGLSMSMLGLWDRQTIGGAITTGTHGSARDLGCLSSFVTKVRLVDGRGEIREISDKEVGELAAAQVSLGLLGVITEIEIQAEPRFFLDRKVKQPTWHEVEENLDVNLERYDYYSAFWMPHSGSALRYGLPAPDDLDMADRTWEQSFTKVPYDPVLDTVERSWFDVVGRSYHTLTADAPGVPSFHEMEYSVPVKHAMEAFRDLRKLVQSLPQPQFPIFVRWVKGDNAMLSPFSGRDSVCFSTSGVPGTDYWPYFRAYHEVLEPYNARGHWGKIHLFDRDYLKRVYPRYEEFVEIRRKFDPTGIFLNDHTRQLFE